MRTRSITSASFLAAVLGISAASTGFVSGAQAADLAYEAAEAAPIAPPLFSWAGFYAGVHGGYVTGDHDQTGPRSGEQPEYKDPLPGNYPPGVLVVPHDLVSFLSTSGSLDGGVIGLYAGYNLQVDRIVLGFEGDIDYSGAKSDTRTSLDKWELDRSFETDWQGSLRARVGYAVDRMLIYGTGGVSFGRGDLTISNHTRYGSSFASDSQVHTGWTAGGGIEYAFTNNWLGRLEARYTDFGSKVYDFGDAGKVDVDWDQTSVLLGLGYKF